MHVAAIFGNNSHVRPLHERHGGKNETDMESRDLDHSSEKTAQKHARELHTATKGTKSNGNARLWPRF